VLTRAAAGSNWRIFDQNVRGFSTILARAFLESTVIVIILIINAFYLNNRTKLYFEMPIYNFGFFFI
jgi:hypothetical protein